MSLMREEIKRTSTDQPENSRVLVSLFLVISKWRARETEWIQASNLAHRDPRTKSKTLEVDVCSGKLVGLKRPHNMSESAAS